MRNRSHRQEVRTIADYMIADTIIPPYRPCPRFLLKMGKWKKVFWVREYYVETVGNITDEAVQKYIKEQAEESRKEDMRSTVF